MSKPSVNEANAGSVTVRTAPIRLQHAPPPNAKSRPGAGPLRRLTEMRRAKWDDYGNELCFLLSTDKQSGVEEGS